MKKIIGMFMLAGAVVLSSTMFAGSSSEVKEIKLREDTLLTTQGDKFSAKFKKGTTAKLDGNGKVLSGVLAQETAVTPVGTGSKKIWFKEGSLITFNEESKVDSGILSRNTSMRPTGVTDVTLRANTQILFHSNGFLKAATLDKEALLPIRKSSKGYKFKAGHEITFDEKGLVISGTLATTINVKRASGETLRFPAGSFIEFDEDGKIANEPPKKSAASEK